VLRAGSSPSSPAWAKNLATVPRRESMRSSIVRPGSRNASKTPSPAMTVSTGCPNRYVVVFVPVTVSNPVTVPPGVLPTHKNPPGMGNDPRPDICAIGGGDMPGRIDLVDHALRVVAGPADPAAGGHAPAAPAPAIPPDTGHAGERAGPRIDAGDAAL